MKKKKEKLQNNEADNCQKLLLERNSHALLQTFCWFL